MSVEFCEGTGAKNKIKHYKYIVLFIRPSLLCILLLINKCYFWITVDSSFWKTRDNDCGANSMEPKEKIITFHSQPR